MNKIRELRKERGLTQGDLAKVLKVSSRTIGFYETGERDPDTDALKLLADYFNVSIDFLLGRIEEREIKGKNDYGFNEGLPQKACDIKLSYNEDLPQEAKEEIEKFTEYIRYKYRKKQ